MWLSFIATVVVLIAGMLLIQLPQVQTALTGRIVSSLSERLDGDISFEKIHIKPFNTLVLKNALVVDRNPYQDKIDETNPQIDTFFRAEYIIARFSLKGLIDMEGIHLHKAIISNAQMSLVIEDESAPDTPDDNLSRIFRIKKPNKPKRSEKEIFHIRDVEIRNMRFVMKNYQSDRPMYPGGESIDWNDLDITDITIDAKNLIFKGGIMSGDAEHVSFREKSGYICKKISGSARVGRGRTIVDEFKLDDPWSEVHLNTFMMSYKNILAFNDFIDDVKIDGEIAKSHISFKTLSYFAPELSGVDINAEVSGNISGYIDDLRMADLKFTSDVESFSGTVNGRIWGLPDIERTHLKADLSQCSITSEGLSKFISEWSDDQNLDLSEFAKGQIFTVEADVDGMLNKMDINAKILSSIGNAKASLNLDNVVIPKNPFSISGRIATSDLDIGAIIGTDLVRQATLKTSFSARLSDGNNPSELSIDTLSVRKLHVNGYDYSNLQAVGKLSQRVFNGKLIANDPNLNLLFQGAFALSSKTQDALYKFYAQIGHADLNAMNLDKRGKSEVRMTARSDIRRTSSGDLLGHLDIGDIVLENKDGIYRVGDINLSSHSAVNKYTVKLKSDFADVYYSGSASVNDFIKDVRDITVKEELPAVFKDSTYTWRGNSYNLSMKCHDAIDILAFILPGYYIEKGTEMMIDLNSKGVLSAGLKSKRLAYIPKDQYVKDFQLSIGNQDNDLSGSLECGEFKFQPFLLKNSKAAIKADNNSLSLRYTFDNQTELDNKGEIEINGFFSRDNDKLNTDISINPSHIYLNSSRWEFMPSQLGIDERGFDIRAMELANEAQRIMVHGRISREEKDTLNLDLNSFDLSLINPMVSKDLGISGEATGNLQLISPMNEIGIIADIICSSTRINYEPLGTLSIHGDWINENLFGIDIRNDIDGKSSLMVRGVLTPDKERLDARISFDKLNIGYADPFVKDIFRDMDGYLSGDILAQGDILKPKISSVGMRLEDASMIVDFTNVMYKADGGFHIDNNGIYFDDITIRDRFDGKGNVKGSIDFNTLKDIRFNTNINVQSIEAINIEEKGSDIFYGNLFGTGKVSITGPVNSLLMNVDASTSKQGSLHIPLTNISSPNRTNLLKFKEIIDSSKIDTYETIVNRMKEKHKKSSDLAVRMRVNASQDVEAFLEIDKASGNILSGRGNGLIDLDIRSDMFNIHGDYTLTGGNYKFVALGLASRDFQIQDGSYIRFNGDIMESTVDINAIYMTKASLSTLISDSTSVSNRRNVECGILISDKLANPRLDFSINVPDLDPIYKSRVESALSSDDKIQKQFLSLILSNSFLPDEQSGIVNNSSILYSNVSEVMANQLNNIFHKLEIPLDLGLNYQPTERGHDIFDVAVSTQLFNNRVIINGNIGNKQYTSGSQEEVVGDIDVEIKLDRSGALRMSLFSHSADQYTNYLDNSQRNGVGIAYQQEFNSFKQFIKRIFSSKKKRQEARMLEEQAIVSEEKITIDLYERHEDNGRRKKRKERKAASDSLSVRR